MYKLSYETMGKEHISYYYDLSDAQSAAQYVRIHLGAENVWISRED